jgi:hypothetical protein
MSLRRSGGRWLACGCLLLLGIGAVDVLGQVSPDTFGSRRRAIGAPVAPVFEGWEQNPDGTETLYFGYMNRNWEEEVDIPVGPNNFFSPGPQDRGQPTHFLVNRQKKVFSVIVPGNFGSQTLVWTLTRHGNTETVPGKLSPLLQVEATRNATSASPNVNLGSDQTITFPQPATLAAAMTTGRQAAEVQGAGGRGRGGRAARLTVKWRMFRGPGKVTFADAAPPVKDGQAVTTATFSEPGVYVLQALADEGSMNDASGIPGFICCWTNAQITITVKAATTAARP